MSSRIGLTPVMRACLDAIESYIATKHCSPSYSDLAAALNLKSRGRIHRLLTALQERGWITFQPNVQRSITIVAGDGGVPSYVLPPKLEAALQRHCRLAGGLPASVVADAVTLFLDGCELDAAA